MKLMKKSGAILLVLILANFAILQPVLPVFAAIVSVTVFPKSGPPGTQITASGDSFTVGSVYTVAFSMGFKTTTVATGAVPAGGSVAAVFPIPLLPRGQYNVNITTTTDNTQTPVPTFTITPQIFIDTAAGMVGDEINIAGNGFNPSQKVSIFFDSSVIASATTDSQGTLASAAVTIPQTTAGKHTISAKDDSGSTPGMTFSINPKITLSVNEITVGSTIIVSGMGFASSKTIFVSIDNRPITGTITSDLSGKFTDFNLKIPELIGGTHTVTASDSSQNISKNDFSVNPSISINPDHGIIGTDVTITGNGFISVTDNPITITYNGIAITTNPKSLTADGNGNFGATFKIPSGAGSAGIIIANDRFSTLSTNFNNTATITVNPLSGHVGTTITASGIGFKNNTAIKITYDTTDVGTATTDTDGKFTTTFSVLDSTSGKHQINITDHVSSLKSIFSVTPEVKTNISSGSIGEDVIADGTGFTAGSNITVNFDTDKVTTTTTDKNGTFTVTFPIPASAGGNHQFTFTDGTNKITSDFSLDSIPPPTPILLLPISSSQASQTPTLKWLDVTDPSGISYSLQIAKDATFNILELQKDGLKGSEYTLTSQDVLGDVSKDTPYYWRVKAIDGANNQSDWSTPFTFYVGNVLKKSNYIMIIMGICVGVGCIAFMVEWLRRR